MTRSTRDLRADPMWWRQRLSESVMRRAISTAVDQYGHQKNTVVTPESTDPPAVQFQAVDITAAGQPIYAQQNGQARTKETNRS